VAFGFLNKSGTGLVEFLWNNSRKMSFCWLWCSILFFVYLSWIKRVVFVSLSCCLELPCSRLPL